MTRAAAPIGLAALALALGFALAGVWPGAPASLALAGAWLAGTRRGWPAASTLGLLGMVGAAADGVLLGVAGPIALVSVVAALAGWDLDRFAQRTRGAVLAPGSQAIERAHLRRLLAVLGVGLALGALALGLRVPLSFGWALALGALAIGALVRAFKALGRDG